MVELHLARSAMKTLACESYLVSDARATADPYFLARASEPVLERLVALAAASERSRGARLIVHRGG